ncbi:MAG: 4Fe-4S binding protein [Lachnospiraceae bacterium]
MRTFFLYLFLLRYNCQKAKLKIIRKKEDCIKITEQCVCCGTCKKHCPQSCIKEGQPFYIEQEHCLHCGNCMEHCPIQAIRIRKNNIIC